MRLAPHRAIVEAVLRIGLLVLAVVPGCYLSHERPADAPIDAGTPCGARSCMLAPRGALRISVEPAEPPLPRRFEAEALGIDPGPEDGIRIVLQTCPGGCRRDLVVTRVGSDRADPAVLSGPVEISLREQALVIRADPCPGCDDGGVAAQLVLAAVTGELRDDDLPLRDVRVEPGEVVCDERGPIGHSSHRMRLAITGAIGRTFQLDEGETRGLGGDHAARVLLTHHDCWEPDLPPPNGLEGTSWIVYAIGPR